MTLRTLTDGKYGRFRIMGNAGFISSTVVMIRRIVRNRKNNSNSDDCNHRASHGTSIIGGLHRVPYK